MTVSGKAAQIPDALLARVLTLSIGSPPLPISLPDMGFDPAADAPDGKYLEVAYFPNRPAWQGISSGVVDQGFLQINVVWKPGAGIIAPMEAVAQVKAHFAKGTELISGSTKVKLTVEPWESGPIIAPDKTLTQITIPWKA